MQTRMKPHLFYTFLTIFAATAVVTLLALTGKVTVVDGYLGWLVSAFLVESAGAVIALFRGAKFFEEPPERHAPHQLKPSAANENDSQTLRLPTLKGGWMLCFIGQKQGEILNAVFSGLRKPFSATGDGKEFSSGLAYWGIIPTWNWIAACQDPKYLRQSLHTMLKKADLEVAWSDYYTYDTGSSFGSAIMLVKKAK